MPRIDPTGERIFAEPPLVLPPQSAAPAAPTAPGRTGPPLHDLPGGELSWDGVEVTLAPRLIVAPVGSEVVLLAGVCGRDGYLRTNRRLEWSLAPGGVGHFVAVGRKGLVDWMLGDFNRVGKVDNTFAVGSTSRKYLRLNRGTPAASDDVCVSRGQGWITLTSPIEGTSRVTVYAPEVYGWNTRTRTATVHWVDAQWRFPPPAINPAGTTHTFTTSVMRQTDQTPCQGWLVRYEILDGPAAGFAPDGAQAVEVATDAAGQADAEIFQKQPAPGINRIGIQIFRPAALTGSDGRRYPVGSGTTTKTWSAPCLAVRKTGPAVAAIGATLSYRIEVSNQGDVPAEDVLVTEEVPKPLTYLGSKPTAEVSGGKIRWRLGRLGAGEVRTLELNFRAARLGSVANCAEATAAGGLKASDCATTTVTAPSVNVKLSGPSRATVGSEVTFQMRFTNLSEVPTGKLLIKDRFDPGLEHAAAKRSIEADLGSLGPGESRQVSVTFRVTKAGRLCHTVELIGEGGVRASAEGCLTAAEVETAQPGPQPQPQPQPQTQPKPEPQPPTAPAAVSVTVTGPRQRGVGETAEFAIELTNTGSRDLTDLKVVDRYDAELLPNMATDGYRLEDGNLAWTIDSLPAGKTVKLAVRCRCRAAAAAACNRVSVAAGGNVLAKGEACLAIVAAAAAAPAGTSRLTVTVADLADPVAVGKGLTYDVRVTNRGEGPDTQATIVVIVPQGMTPAPLGTHGPGSTRYTIDGQTIRFDPVDEVGPGETLHYRIRVNAGQAGRPTLRVELSSRNLPQPVRVEETTEVFQQ